MTDLIPIERIESKIYYIRNQKVILDKDLAELYGVETRTLKQAVRRNKYRFPKDFMFILSQSEIDEMVSQSVIPSKSYFGGAKPFVFTEQGIAMLSSILNSRRAIEINIRIMRTFTKLRKMIMDNEKIKRKIEAIERKYDNQFRVVFKAIKEILDDKKKIPKKRRIGF